MRPFYALDARWAAGVTASKDDRIDAVYNAGNVASQYRHQQNRAEVFGGWSQGLVDGWVRRYCVGVNLQDDAFKLESGRIAPTRLPPDEKVVAPFVRFDLIEDRYERQQNRNLIARPEFFALGFASSVQLGWAATGLGSSLTDLYVWRLFRIGGAAFFDAGRAWGGHNPNTVNPGWLSDAGFGLRIVSSRAAFSNVLHLDVAFPLNPTADVKKVQFLIKTKVSL